jgi:hypothetical protein
MKTFTYPFLYKIFFRFGNIPFTILLAAYIVPSVDQLDKDLIFLIPLIISLVLIYYLNKQYFALYKIVPYKIEAYDDHIVCSNFAFQEKVVEIYFQDIDSLKGGIYEGKLKGMLKIYDSKNKITIGYFSKLKDSNKLGTILLSKVRKSVYDEVINKITEAGKRKGK